MGVKEFVDNEIETNTVAIFSKSTCPYCAATKKLFATEFPDVKTQIFDIDEREDGAEIHSYLLEKTGQRTVPNVFVNKKHIGGNDATQAAFKKGEFASLA